MIELYISSITIVFFKINHNSQSTTNVCTYSIKYS